MSSGQSGLYSLNQTSDFAVIEIAIDSTATIDFISFGQAWASITFADYIGAADPNCCHLALAHRTIAAVRACHQASFLAWASTEEIQPAASAY